MTCARRRAGARTPASPTSAVSPRRPDARTGRARARRLALLLPVLALLAGAFSLFAPAPAQAQNTPVWSATLHTNHATGLSGVASLIGCSNANGFSHQCTETTKFTDDDFTHGGTTYTITELGFALRSAGNQVILSLSSLTGAQTKTSLTGLTLNFGSSASYAIADGTASGNRLTWASSLGWTGTTKPASVTVSLTSGSSAPSAPTNLGVSPGNGSLSLTWTAPSGTLTGYDVHYTSAASGTVSNSATASGNNAATAWVAVSPHRDLPPDSLAGDLVARQRHRLPGAGAGEERRRQRRLGVRVGHACGAGAACPVEHRVDGRGPADHGDLGRLDRLHP